MPSFPNSNHKILLKYIEENARKEKKKKEIQREMFLKFHRDFL